MVVNIVSLPGVMSPEMVEKFKAAIEKMAQKELDRQVNDRNELQQALTAGFTDKARALQEPPQPSREQAQSEGPQQQTVEGYKMEETQPPDESTKAPSSGVEWFAALFVLMLIGLFVFGSKRKL